MRHLFYLHGFASSPGSGKAMFLANRLAEHDLTLHCPDLNTPDFSTLTTTRMVEQVLTSIADLEPAPVVLFGSSLGAFVALHTAERLEQTRSASVAQMIFLSPALEFGTSRANLGDDEMRRWRNTGWLEMTHHAYGETRRVHYELFADAGRYDSFATSNTVPTLILQGRHDDVVDPAMVERFATARRHVRLVMVDDSHQLKESLERVWSETLTFLGLPASRWRPHPSSQL